MKVTNSDNNGIKKDPSVNLGKAAEKGKIAYAGNAAQAKEAASTPQGTQGGSDKVLVSDLGKEVAKVHAQIKKSPDVRADKVAALKQKIDNGSYKVSSGEIANKIIEDAVKNG